MIPVEQRRLWSPDEHPDGPQRGDCAAACIASIFELPYEECEEIEGDSQSVFAWTNERFPGLRYEHKMVGDGWKGVERIGDHVKWPREHRVDGYWMATIWSPRVPDVDLFGCGCADRNPGGDPNCEWCGGKPEARLMGIQWGLHAVVMRDSHLVWDPHPDREPDAPLYFCSASRWLLLDPSCVRPRCVRGACGEGLVDECYHQTDAQVR